jgi:hypothetical protein
MQNPSGQSALTCEIRFNIRCSHSHCRCLKITQCSNCNVENESPALESGQLGNRARKKFIQNKPTPRCSLYNFLNFDRLAMYKRNLVQHFAYYKSPAPTRGKCFSSFRSWIKRLTCSERAIMEGSKLEALSNALSAFDTSPPNSFSSA